MDRIGSEFERRSRSWMRHMGARRLLRDPLARYTLLGLFAAGVVIAALTLLAAVMVEDWSQRDIDLRSRLVFRSIRDQVAMAMTAKPDIDLAQVFERITEDERILALGFCSAQGQLRYATKEFPKSVTCDSLKRTKSSTFAAVADSGRHIHISSFPITVADSTGHLLVLHDLAYIEARTNEARLYTLLALVGVTSGLGLLATAIVLALMRAWTRSIRGALTEVRHGAVGEALARSPFPISREVHAALSELRMERRFANGIHVEWSPKTLHRLLVEELPDAQVLVVSNREPYIHNRSGGELTLQIPASGLVAALEPVMRACGGTWIAHGSGSGDRDTVDASDRLRVPPAEPTYLLRRVWLSEKEQSGYYYGLANEGLWPLCHIAFVRPTFREEDWAQYRKVNERFADAIVEEATCDDPIVLVQDYHFALLPRMIRDRLPKATVIAFWHIPWPNAETFGICPWRREIIDGLLGSTILGFHTQFHCNNFLETADRFMESRIDREHDSVTFRGDETLIRPYPISIEWPPAALVEQAPVRECRDAVRRRFSLPADVRIAVGIERFDYTKGILDRIRAVDDLLTCHPEWIGRLVFIQAAAPTRSKLATYSSLQGEAEQLVTEVNARHGNKGFQPIRLVVRHHEPGEVFELFRASDMCIVSSLHDGMNLVAKEFVAARDDEHGVLILSSFAGASRELSEALIVNPYDTHGMAEAFVQALQMSHAEQRDRMRLMRDLVRERNVYRWAAQMLLDAARLRQRQRIVSSNALHAGRAGPQPISPASQRRTA
ncbi:trehalose-6-phosphate synthase [Bradyrhizobium sp. ISRA443]|uniref:alpha,alpha-trehalose-phosphate synthase (UDP-forming) n=1 Tax=unclassified Bradyrhizobium TaxID=2631580 RepID=UPI002478A27F|nr:MULTISPECIES: trehalose-6-phosphate synthase [unclassified Bradyrhizobium]WGS01619.1 trehalose-6-phosphate synthase [Bradyrhizobium sp. ISRA436]WGS08505.1 trehalose-6-phosphate synthase [Bradyrhizobium sp. ISRA437]WGS15393.1 trehalose-6-phosphate synthase [Bradyrhizobium sp. ISRA443]